MKNTVTVTSSNATTLGNGEPICSAMFRAYGVLGDTPEAYRVRRIERALRELVRVRDADAANHANNVRAKMTDAELAELDIVTAAAYASAWGAARFALDISAPAGDRT